MKKQTPEVFKPQKKFQYLCKIESEIKHTTNDLYRIKGINRNKSYKISELQGIVWKSKHGKKVIDTLKDKKVTETTLRVWGQHFLADLLGPRL